MSSLPAEERGEGRGLEERQAARLVVRGVLEDVSRRVERRQRVDGADVGPTHDHLAAGGLERVPDRRRRDARLEQVERLLRHGFRIGGAGDDEEVGRRRGVGLALVPALGRLADDRLVELPGLVGREVPLGGGVARVVLERERQGAEDRLRVLPADHLEEPLRAGRVDRLMADVPEVAHRVAEEELEDVLGVARPGQRDGGAVHALDVPLLDRVDERPARLVRGRDPDSSTAGSVHPVFFFSSACDALK